MIPNHRLSAVPNYAPFQAPRDRVKSPLVDYHLGGNGIEDNSGGMRSRVWTGRYLDGAVYLWATGVAPVNVLTIADVEELSFCFDQDARPVIAYELSTGGCALRWWNPGEEEFQTVAVASATSPRVTLDDSRPESIADSDVLFTYMRDGVLYFREQRDAFAVEYELRTGLAGKMIGRFGMNERQAIQWQLVTALGADPAVPVATTLHAIDTPPFQGGSPGLGVWLAAAGPATWPGCSIEISRDGGYTWEFVGTVVVPAILGELGTLLPDHAAEPADETNTLRAALVTSGVPLGTVTPAQLEAEPALNLAIVEGEQMQWADAALVSGTTWDLDYLRRGRNGTTTEAHAIGSRFVVLVGHDLSSRLLFLPLEPGDVGEELQFRATTMGAAAPTGFDELTFEGLSAAT
jgi:hypothetical protein